MIYLGSIPVLCDIFACVACLVWLFQHADRLVDRMGARLHHRRHGGRRASGVLLPRGVRLPLQARSFVSSGQQRSRS